MIFVEIIKVTGTIIYISVEVAFIEKCSYLLRQ